MTTTAIGIEKTVELHRSLASMLPGERDRLASALAVADRSMRKQDRSFGGQKEIASSLSALLLDDRDAWALGRVAETLHEIVEHVLDWLFASQQRLDRYFSDHRRVFPFLAKTRGWDARQVISRYDAVVTDGGRIKILELNAGCPAGFMHAESFSRATARAFESLDIRPSGKEPKYGTIDSSALVEGLLDVERRAGVEQGIVGLLTDENGLSLELDLMAEQFTRRGREPFIIDARELEYNGDRLRWRGRHVSLTYNKFRVSVPTSRNHFWADGFDDRYAAFLAALCDGAVVSANNLCGLTVGEDKSLLELLTEPDLVPGLTDSQRRFLEEHILWTARLDDKAVRWQSETVDLLPLVRNNRRQFVIKPCNEGRGFGVYIGKHCSDDQWRELCIPDPDTPQVVQQYVEPLTLPVLTNGGTIDVQDMYLTLGLALVCGRYRGVLSRVSPNCITNVAREGMVQAVLCTGRK